MASTFANRDTQWYIRTDGNELNGGGFDPYVTNAGTNYCDQAAAQLSLTDLATSGISANVSSVTGGFTSAMIGNVLRLASGTNATADYYVITAVTDTNNATLDRNCCTGAMSGGVCRVGGAHAHIKQYATSSNSGTNNPVLATPLIGGNQVNIRGSGSDDPSVNDYDWSGDYWNYPQGGNLSNGNLRFVGYNGRPRIAHRGLLLFNCGWSYMEHFKFFASLGTHTTHGIVSGSGSPGGTTAYYDCIFDSNGKDQRQCWFGNTTDGAGHVIGCDFRNTGGGAAGTQTCIVIGHGGCFIFGTRVDSQRGNGISMNGCYGGLHVSLISNNLVDGFKDTETDASAPIPLMVMNTTFYANGGHGLNIAANGIANIAIFNNIISSHVGASKYGISFADSRTTNEKKYKFLIGYNDYYGNTNGNFNQVASADTWAINPTQDGVNVGDLTLDPGFNNAAGGDFRIGSNVHNMGVIAPPNIPTAAVIDMGGVRGAV